MIRESADDFMLLCMVKPQTVKILAEQPRLITDGVSPDYGSGLCALSLPASPRTLTARTDEEDTVTPLEPVTATAIFMKDVLPSQQTLNLPPQLLSNAMKRSSRCTDLRVVAAQCMALDRCGESLAQRLASAAFSSRSLLSSLRTAMSLFAMAIMLGHTPKCCSTSHFCRLCSAQNHRINSVICVMPASYLHSPTYSYHTLTNILCLLGQNLLYFVTGVNVDVRAAAHELLHPFSS